MKNIKTTLSSSSPFTVAPTPSPVIDFSVAGTALTIDPAYGQYLSAGDKLVVVNGGTGGYVSGTVLTVLEYGGALLNDSVGIVDTGITGSTGTALLSNWTPSNVISAGENSIKTIENAAFIEVSNLTVQSDDSVLVSVLPTGTTAGNNWTQVTFVLESVIDTATDLPVADAVIQLQLVDVVNFQASDFATLTNLTPGDIFMTSGLYPEFGAANQTSNISGILGIALYNPSLSLDYYVTGTLMLTL
jgi:hypothetical protein